MRIGDYKYRFIDQPSGWLGGTVKLDWPILRQPPPRSRSSAPGMARVARTTSNWFMYEFWRFVFVQQEVAEVRPDLHRVSRRMQKPASFNLDAVKEQVSRAIQSHRGA